MENKKVLLHYLRHKICRKWDKILSLQPSQLGNLVSVPNRWVIDINSFKSMFPDRETLTKYLIPIALAEYPYAFYEKGTCVTAQILDAVIEFKVVSCETLYCSTSMSLGQVVFDIENNEEVKYINETLPGTTTEVKYAILFPELNERLTLQCNVALNITFNDTSRISKRSAVICGPHGSGKSHFLTQWCYQQKKSLEIMSSGVWILQLDANQHNSTTHLGTALPSAFPATHKEEESNAATKFTSVTTFLKYIISLIGKPEHLHKLETLTPSNHSCIIVIDNLDVTFQSNATNNDMESTDSRTFFYLQLSHCIYSLVQLLTDPTFSCNFFLIASSQLDTHQLYSSNTNSSSTARCPDFELVLPLPRLSHSSRMKLIEQLLLSHSLCIDLSIVDEHASKIADMTRGFTPGSIVKVFEEVMRVRDREQQLPNVINIYPTSTQTLLATFFEAAVNIRRTSEQTILHQFSSPSDGDRGSNTSNSGNPSKGLTFDDFAGYEEVKMKLRRLLQSLKANPRASSEDKNSLKLTVVPVRGVVLHGAVGCGKTFLAQVLAAEAQMAFLPVRSTQLLSKYFGDTEAQIRSLFRAARDSAPCVLFFDDFDVLARHRGRHHKTGINKNVVVSDEGDDLKDDNDEFDDDDDDDGGEELQSDLQGRVLSTFLNELDGVHSAKNTDRESSVLVLVACRHLHQLDDALLRPGRLQVHVQLGKPDRDTVMAIISKYLAKVPCGHDLQIASIVDDLFIQKRPSCAQAKAVCTDAIMAAIREDIEQMESRKLASGETIQDQISIASFNGQVCQRHFLLNH